MGIGDVIMASPIFNCIKNKYKNCEIWAVVSNNACKNVLLENPFIKKIIIINKKNNYTEKFFPLSGLCDLLKLRKTKFDLSVTCFPHALYANFASLIIGAKTKIGHYNKWLDVIYGKKNKLDTSAHQLRQNLNLFNCKTNSPKIYLGKSEILNKQKKLIGFHPGCDAVSPFKRWSEKNFFLLAEKLSKKGFNILFFLGPDESYLKESIENLKNKKIKYFDDKNLRKAIIKINSCSWFISNDSGLMHIAGALNIPVLGIFGPSDYNLTGPQIYKKYGIITPKGYSPWSNIIYEKTNNVSKSDINAISPDEVYKEFQKLNKYL